MLATFLKTLFTNLFVGDVQCIASNFRKDTLFICTGRKNFGTYFGLFINSTPKVYSFLGCLFCTLNFGNFIPFSHLKVLYLEFVHIFETLDLMSKCIVKEDI